MMASDIVIHHILRVSPIVNCTHYRKSSVSNHPIFKGNTDLVEIFE
jgi:hypothetical protein